MLPAHSRLFANRLLLAAVLTLSHAGMARADEIQDVSKMVRAGQYDQALQRADAYLATKPRNAAQMRFLKGLILTEQNKTSDAIAVFQRLSEDFPELPEPYNNLAVLYASQGQFDKARTALEMAIRTHPSYATAHENLGDVYAKLASQAYDRALQLDSSNSAAQTKLALIRDLVGGTGQRAPSATPAKPASSAAPAPLPPLAAVTPVTPNIPAVQARPPEPAKSATPVPPAARAAVPAKPAAAPAAPAAPASPAAPAASVPVAAPAPAPAAPRPETLARASESAEVSATVQGWARAWSSQDINVYLASYDREFQPPRGLSRDAWEKERRSRIVGRAKISVTLEDVKVDWDGATAKVKFRQHYKSDQLVTNSIKLLTLTKTNGKWLIKQERNA